MRAPLQNRFLKIVVVLLGGLLAAFISQLFREEPTSHNIHVRNFRYGKDPSVIRCNRGDTLHLTFSTTDTGHSFFLEEFDMDVKVSPAREKVSVFRTSDPTLSPEIKDTVTLIASHPGLQKYLISRSNYRCHVWCGPMHAFEQGKLVIFPNTLLFFSLGALLVVILLWVFSFRRREKKSRKRNVCIDILDRLPFLRKLLVSRWPQLILTLLALVMMYLVIITGIFGTKVSGRNLGVLLMWVVWLFILVAILTPLFGRSWCSICPLPFFGDWLQRGSLFLPLRGKTGGYNNRYFGFFKKWPQKLDNNWLRLFFFLILSTFSTTLVAKPWVSGFVVFMLILIPSVMSLIWQKRSFCRYLCPVSVFVSPFSGESPIVVQPKSQEKCDSCKPHFCEKGSAGGWACPYGLNVGKMDETPECGLCLECLRSCSFKNVTIAKRPFAGGISVRSLSDAWIAIAIFSMAIIYSVVYLGTSAENRDYVNILDKQNWDLFGVYSLVVWLLVLVVVPLVLWSFSKLAVQLSGALLTVRELFFRYSNFLLPLGMMFWITFVIPMLFVNVTFIAQSASDPFGWGWDFFGTSNIPWHQFLPQYIPWFQAVLVLWGFYLSLKKAQKNLLESYDAKTAAVLAMPIAFFLTGMTVFMIFFFTN